MPPPNDRIVRKCTSLGPLEAFVESFDEGPAARSLHILAGRLHTALGDEAGKRAWVGEVRRRFAATAAAVFECDTELPSAPAVTGDPRGWSGHAMAASEMTQALRGAPVGEAVAYSTAASAGGIGVNAAAAKVAHSRVIGLVLARTHDAALGEQAALQHLAPLVWHMQCADHAARLAAAQPGPLSPADVLDLLPVPCLITDAVGRSIERNDAFASFMQEAGVQVTTGRVAFKDPYLQDSWQVALGEVHATVVRQSLLATAPNGREWQVHLSPFRCALANGDAPRALILVVAQRWTPGGEPMDAAMPESSRPLTPAESAVLDALMQGHSAKVIAHARGASVNTVRSQIMTILGKTGHHNQKALMAAFGPSAFRSSVFSELSSGSSRNPRTKR